MVKWAGVALGAVLACASAGAAQAAYIIDFEEVGGNVVATGSGSLDLSRLSPLGSATASPQINPMNGQLAIGTTGNGQGFSGLFGPASFGFGGASFADASTGPTIGFVASTGTFFIYPGFTGGTVETSTATFNNTTIAGIGLDPNTSFTYRLGFAANSDTLTVVVGSSISPVPLPASAPMFGAALLALGGIGYARHRKRT